MDNLTEKQLAELSAWAAEKIGLTDLTSWMGTVKTFDGTFNGRVPYKWDIRDARCRELVREKLKIETLFGYAEDVWFAESEKCVMGNGDSPKEAEINCLWAIFEGERL